MEDLKIEEINAETENWAAVLHGPNDLRIEKIPMPEIDDHEVLIRMESVGVCGSDLALYSTGRCGAETVTEPIVLGHEGAGVVVKVGSKVSSLAPGARVAVEPTQPCLACEFCRGGRYNLCPAPRYCSTSGAPGNLCRYYKHSAAFCHPIPDSMSFAVAASLQPLAVAVHGARRGGVALGARVAVLGAGPVGALCAAAARAMGAAKVVVTDVSEYRLSAAAALGAAPLSVLGLSAAEAEAALVRLLGARPDLTVDACGRPEALATALNVTKSGGRVLVVGIGEREVTCPLTPALLREVDVIGTYRFSNAYPAAMQAASGAVDLEKLITHHLPLARSAEAIQLCRSGQAMKVIIDVQQ